MKGLVELAPHLGPRAIAAALHACRLLPVALLCPFLGGPFVAPMVRVLLAAGLGVSAWASLGGSPFAGAPLAAAASAVAELALGTSLGVLALLPFEAARAGGRLVDTLRGSTLAELHVAPLRQRESATGDLLSWTLLASAASGGGDRLVVAALLATFRTAPVGAGLDPHLLLSSGLWGLGELLACALAVGAPAAAGLLAAELALALAARASPAVASGNTQPARAALGLAAVALPAAALGGRLAQSLLLSVGAIAGAASRAGGRSP